MLSTFTEHIRVLKKKLLCLQFTLDDGEAVTVETNAYCEDRIYHTAGGFFYIATSASSHEKFVDMTSKDSVLLSIKDSSFTDVAHNRIYEDGNLSSATFHRSEFIHFIYKFFFKVYFLEINSNKNMF